jgi:hypothetical protein
MTMRTSVHAAHGEGKNGNFTIRGQALDFNSCGLYQIVMAFSVWNNARANEKWKKQNGGGLIKMMKSKKAKQTFWVERLTMHHTILLLPSATCTV